MLLCYMYMYFQTPDTLYDKQETDINVMINKETNNYELKYEVTLYFIAIIIISELQ